MSDPESSQSSKATYLFICKACGKEGKVLLSHLKKKPACQEHYDVNELYRASDLAAANKKRQWHQLNKEKDQNYEKSRKENKGKYNQEHAREKRENADLNRELIRRKKKYNTCIMCIQECECENLKCENCDRMFRKGPVYHIHMTSAHKDETRCAYCPTVADVHYWEQKNAESCRKATLNHDKHDGFCHFCCLKDIECRPDFFDNFYGENSMDDTRIVLKMLQFRFFFMYISHRIVQLVMIRYINRD